MGLIKTLISIQAGYTLFTAIWPIVHIESFMEVTGYKTDIWLVKTVGALLIPVAACLLSYIVIKSDRRPGAILGTLTCIAFISVDFFYATADVISDVYLLDGAVHVIFLSLWIYIWWGKYRELIAQ
jgi:hypothetical protein